HRSHYYQRLVGLGWSHKKTVLAEYLLMISCSISAILLFHNKNIYFQVAVLGGVLVVYTMLAVAIVRMEKLKA
ncbi:MAG: glycosyl transferase family 4, partial [Gammaproteobacteria bacterium]|nr:glycosyl transferase family 4 [Gammaproteobacteria bacterium]